MRRDVRGLLADVNIHGHLTKVGRLLKELGLWPFLAELGLELVTSADLGLRDDLDDRSLWNFCQKQGWVLLTDNRNDDGEDSLHRTITDSWRVGDVPVLTLANNAKFKNRPEYAERVVTDVAELLLGIAAEGRYCDQPRIYLPTHGGGWSGGTTGA